MKKIILPLRMAVKTVMIALLLGVVGKMYAYDFSAVCETGQTLYYNISGSNVTITHPNTYIEEPWSGYTEPEGIIVLPSSVTNNSVTYSVTSIGNYAFRECTFISFVNIPNSVVSIGNSAFEDCWNLTSVNIPNSVNRIGTSAFSGCSKINVFNIPNSVNSIGKEAFWGTGWYNNQANDILYLDNWCLGYKGNAPSGQLEIQDGTRNIANGAFRECIHLTAVNIPNSLITIGSDTFRDCYYLSSVILGNSVKTIGMYAFYDCLRLTSIIIPNTIVSIGEHAFYDCSALSSVTILANAVPILMNRYAFTNAHNSLIIYVPYESLDDYKTASNWSNYVSRIFPMASTAISGYSEGNGNWQFIASPLAESTAPTEIGDMIPTTGTYDLYRFDQSENAEWQNYKANSFNLVDGQGYLYANAEDVNLIFKGEFNEEETKEVSLAYDANATFAGWNLVGNPFPVSAYTNRSYYVMNEAGTAIEPVAVSMETAIPACTGIMVKAETNDETVTFSKTTPETQGQYNGLLQIAVAQANTRGNTIQDKAIVSFNAVDRLEKFVFNKDNAKLYIPQSDKDLAIACAMKEGEMTLNFKASKNGKYTITVNPEAVEMDYLHLIDNMTGKDIDLLASPSYTFNAQTTDYASRFRLVFSASGEADGNNAPFAFINNGNIVFTGMGGGAFNASLQIVDVQGRIIVCRDAVPASLSTAGMASGVYVLRLINGDDVKTQKIVVR